MKILRQKYILAPGAKGNEILNSLAMFGQNTFGVKLVSDLELAKIACFSSGILTSPNITTDDEMLVIIANILQNRHKNQDDDHFRTSSFVDVQNIARSINLLRNFMPCDEEAGFKQFCEKAEFPKKNKALYEVYADYRSQLDAEMRIDKIDFLREVCSAAKVGSIVKLDGIVIIADEFPITPLQNELVKACFDEKNIMRISLKEGENDCEQPQGDNDSVLPSNKVEYAKSNTYEHDGDVSVPTRKNVECEKSINKLQQNADAIPPSNKIEFVKTYGATNEIEHLFACLASKNIALDECLISVTNTKSYVHLLYEFCVQHDIPITFGCGLPVTMTNAASFLANMQEWATSGIFGKSALSKMVYHESFNTQKLLDILQIEWELLPELLDLAGSLRLSFDTKSNLQKLESYKKTKFKFPQKFGKPVVDEDIFEATRILGAEFAEGPVYLLQTYTQSPNFANKESWQISLCSVIEESAKKSIAKFLETYTSIYGADKFAEAVPYVLNMQAGAQSSKPGFIHVEKLDNSLSILRPKVFIVGLSADKFPGSPQENYLVLDNDLAILRDFYELEYVPNSSWVVEHKISNLLSLYNNIEINNCELSISWPYFNSQDLKELNPSSAVYEIWRRATGSEVVNFKAFDAEVKKVGFFEYCLDKDFLLKRDYKEGRVTVPCLAARKGECEELESECIGPGSTDDIESASATPNEAIRNPIDFSKIKIAPSRASTLKSCPLAFYLDSLLGMSELEDDEQRVALPPMDCGTIAHACMELLCTDNPLSREDFVDYGLNLLNDFFAYRPAFFADSEDDAIADFTELLISAYDQDCKFAKRPQACEKYLQGSIDGFEIHGYVDRIEKDDDGSLTIVDFKTGRKIKHANQDAASCIQGLLYAFLLNKSNKIKAEFRYPRKFNPNFPIKNFSIASCDYSHNDVHEYFEDLRTRLHDFDFSPIVEPEKRTYDDGCKYCAFREICDEEHDFSISSDTNSKDAAAKFHGSLSHEQSEKTCKNNGGGEK